MLTRFRCTPRLKIQRRAEPPHNIESSGESVPEVGTLAWELERGGRLSPGERFRMTASIVPAYLSRMIHAWADTAESSRCLADVDVDSLRIPPESEAIEAFNECRSAASLTRAYHAVRVFFFGMLLGRAQRLSFDTNLFCVAALLHDVGLTRRYRYQGDDCHCYAVASARAAYRISERWRWPEPRRERLREAIVRYLNPAVTRRAGIEAYLLHAGAEMDWLGAGLERLPHRLVCGIYRHYPRGNFAADFAAEVRVEAKTRPRSRTALREQFGFSRAIAADRPGRIDCTGS